MNWKRIFPISMVMVLLLVLTGGLLTQHSLRALACQSIAQGPEPQAGPGGNEGGIPQAPLDSGFTYQGQLKDGGGNPIDDTCDFTFGLWDAETDGAQVGSDSVVTGVAVTDGYFAALVNSGGEFGAGAFSGEARWLEITVHCTADPSPVTLSPRQLLSAAPYAAYSTASPWTGLVSVPADFADNTDNDALAELTASSGQVPKWDGSAWTASDDDDILGGLSCANGQIAEWDGSAWVCGDDDAGAGPHDHWGESWSGSGTGLTLSGGDIGLSGNGSTYGLYGESDSTIGNGVRGTAPGLGVYGLADATSGATYGVYGRSNSNQGYGVSGYASSTWGSTYGVQGESISNAGSGVLGLASATSGTTYGVWGQSDSPDGYGVYGYAPAANGLTYGVYGMSDSTDGRGVVGYAPAASGVTYGVYGMSDSTLGRGVYGVSPLFGVSGLADAASGVNYGVYGKSTSPEGYGVYGLANATTGTTYGVYGKSDSTDGGSCGVFGEATAASNNVYGVRGNSPSTSGIGVVGYASAPTGDTIGVWGWTMSPDGQGVYGSAVAYNADYGVYSYGNFAASGSKAAIVPTQDYSWRHLYSVESPEVLFEDVGTAQLVKGQAVVVIEPIFAQTVNLEEPYQVFLTPLGDCGLYVAEQTATSFSVRSLDGRTCDISFHYRIIAKRLGYENIRLAPAEDPAITAQGSAPEVQP